MWGAGNEFWGGHPCGQEAASPNPLPPPIPSPTLQELEEMRHECMVLLREKFHLEQCIR